MPRAGSSARARAGLRQVARSIAGPNSATREPEAGGNLLTESYSTLHVPTQVAAVMGGYVRLDIRQLMRAEWAILAVFPSWGLC